MRHYLYASWRRLLPGALFLTWFLKMVRRPGKLLLCSRVAALMGICALFAASLVLHGSPTAYAIQAKPPTDESFYMNSGSTSESYTLGCNQGKTDAAYNHNSEVVLDFGGQIGNGSGSYLIGGGTLTNSQLEAVAENFADGYWTCTGADTSTLLYLGIGTNNSAGDVSTAGGQTWGNDVVAAQAYDVSKGYNSQVVMVGANDLESGSGWSSASAASAWAQGFSSKDGFYIDFGSANGCPTSQPSGVINASCNDGWTQEDYWYLSWGNSAAVPAPEIYNSAMAHQWATLSLFSAKNHTDGRILMQGPWDEYDEDHSTLTATQAWDDLWNDLNANSATAQNMPYSLEIWTEY